MAYETEVPRPRDAGRIFMAAFTNYLLATYRPQGGVTLDAIGGNGVRYSWFQSQFIKRAEEVYKAQGIAFFTHVRDALPATDESISVEESLARLEKISPGFVKWAADLAAQGSAAGVQLTALGPEPTRNEPFIGRPAGEGLFCGRAGFDKYRTNLPV